MRNEFEQFVAKHGAYWVVALVAVAIGKLYSREKQTIKTVLRSVLASLAISFIVVEQFTGSVEQSTRSVEQSTVFMYVFVASILSDVIVEVLMRLGVRIKEDPSLLTRFLPWGNKN